MSDFYNKGWCFEKAIKITKEYARGGGELDLDNVLESTYNKLVKISDEIK